MFPWINHRRPECQLGVTVISMLSGARRASTAVLRNCAETTVLSRFTAGRVFAGEQSVGVRDRCRYPIDRRRSTARIQVCAFVDRRRIRPLRDLAGNRCFTRREALGEEHAGRLAWLRRAGHTGHATAYDDGERIVWTAARPMMHPSSVISCWTHARSPSARVPGCRIRCRSAFTGCCAAGTEVDTAEERTYTVDDRGSD